MPRAPASPAAWLYGRGVALAARGRIAEARTDARAAAGISRPQTPEDALAGFNTLRGVLAVAQPVVAARIAASEYHDADAVRLLQPGGGRRGYARLQRAGGLVLPHAPPARCPVADRRPCRRGGARLPRTTSSTTRTTAGRCHGLTAGAEARRARAAEAARTRRAAPERPGSTPTCSLPGSAFWFAGADTTNLRVSSARRLARPAGGREFLRAQHEARVDRAHRRSCSTRVERKCSYASMLAATMRSR